MHRSYKCESVLLNNCFFFPEKPSGKIHRNLCQYDCDYISSSHVFSDVKQANKREGEFYNSGYIDYTISTISNHPAFPAGYFTVERRFSDFVW